MYASIFLNDNKQQPNCIIPPSHVFRCHHWPSWCLPRITGCCYCCSGSTWPSSRQHWNIIQLRVRHKSSSSLVSYSFKLIRLHRGLATLHFLVHRQLDLKKFLLWNLSIVCIMWRLSRADAAGRNHVLWRLLVVVVVFVFLSFVIKSALLPSCAFLELWNDNRSAFTFQNWGGNCWVQNRRFHVWQKLKNNFLNHTTTHHDD